MYGMQYKDLSMDNFTDSNQSNDHNKFKSTFYPWEDYIIGVFLILGNITAVVLNLMVLIVTLKRRKQLRYPDYYIINLAVCDIGHPLFGYPMTIISSFSHEWVLGRIGCEMYGYLGFQFGVGSMATLAVMAFVRYLTVCKPSSGMLLVWLSLGQAYSDLH
ncbi:hypothetical protein SNE40_006377 [Patella caerulea]|uniref:G-protein coupled receptors family 1 profile domain-containing protein n=1 Tax=Patella caerulea TaxID=87958 RepID=A0AAN8JVU6_PATCE